MNASDDVALLQELHERSRDVKDQIARIVIGNDEVVDDLLSCFFAGGHALLIGVPGLAKTTLVRTLAASTAMDFNRVQFTPDLMPSDITGSEILYEERGSGVREFRFVKGPLFTNILLADEINRTPPKTQSALLQAMAEYEVTSSGTTYGLPSPFFVLATQNPIEQEGTYPLPEAQQDRFMFSIYIDYPDAATEVDIVKKTTVPDTATVTAVLDEESIRRFRDLVLRIPAADSVVNTAVSLVRATRPGSDECPQELRSLIQWGAGPRASQYIVLAAKVYAAMDGRSAPEEPDIRRAAWPVLRHRIVRSFHAQAEGVDTDHIIRTVLDHVGH